MEYLSKNTKVMKTRNNKLSGLYSIIGLGLFIYGYQKTNSEDQFYKQISSNTNSFLPLFQNSLYWNKYRHISYKEKHSLKSVYSNKLNNTLANATRNIKDQTRLALFKPKTIYVDTNNQISKPQQTIPKHGNLSKLGFEHEFEAKTLVKRIGIGLRSKVISKVRPEVRSAQFYNLSR